MYDVNKQNVETKDKKEEKWQSIYLSHCCNCCKLNCINREKKANTHMVEGLFFSLVKYMLK